MKKQKIIIILLIIVMMLLVLTTNSNAALQANGSTGTTQSLDNWMINIRKMEAVGGTLGLTETINSDLTSSSGSNNLDIHMEKNTEYGAIAILSASSYGNPNKIQSGGTTTGNETGIVMNLNKEWVAAGWLKNAATFTNANKRYKNVYEGTPFHNSSASAYELTYTAKIGDAVGETKGWHGSGYSQWLSEYYWTTSSCRAIYNAGLLRAYSGSIFSYYGYCQRYGEEHRNFYDAYYSKPWYSRAIMVCGEGI